MVLALYVLAGVMTAGGLAAIYSGSDIIVMERGWTMVIAGSVMAASGAILAGVTTAVARLQVLEGQFARLSDRLARPEAPSFSPSPDLAPEVVRPGERLGAPPVVTFPDLGQHKDLDITPEPVLNAPPPEPAESLSEDIFAPVGEPSAIATEPDMPEAAPASAPDSAPVEAAEPQTPTIVGTYNSGGNFYIMYSDGSIEAETPAGKFRFNSLDELKEFIAAGGDKAKATS